MGESRVFFKALVLGACFAAFGALVHFGSPAFSADSGTNVSTNDVPVPGMTFGPGPEFKAANTINMGNLINTCMMNPAMTNLQSMMQNGVGGMSVGGMCPGAEIKVDRSSLECSNFEVDGKFDGAAFDAFKASVAESKTSLSCQKHALQGLQQELSCLSTQVSAMQNQIKTLEASFTQNMGSMAEYVSVMKAAEEDRKQQFEDVQKHLNGDERTGRKGLLLIDKEMGAVVDAMKDEIKGIKESHRSVDIQKKAFEEDVARKTMAMTNVCFSTRKKSNYHCVPNGPSVTAREYVLCRFEQNQRLGHGGVVEVSSIRVKQAESKRAELENILDQILGDSPSQTKNPKNQEEAMEQAEQAINILNPTDLEAEYGAKLSSFDGKGLAIHGFVMKVMGLCYKESQKTIKKQRQMVSTALGRAQEAIKAQERETRKQVNGLLTKYATSYSQGWSALTGMHMPVNADGCRQSKPSSQETCLDDLESNLRGLWNGNTPQSTVNYSIRGNDPKTTIGFQCQGVHGCTATLQTLGDNLEKDRNRIKAEKEKQIQAFNRQVEARSKQIATALSTENLRLNDQLTKLNAQLTALGGRGNIRLGHVKAERLEKDEDGLYRAPTSVLGVISNYMGEPGLLDLQDGTFSESLSSVSDRVKEIGEKEAEASQMLAQLDGRKSKCIEMKMKELAKLLEQDVASMSECYRDIEFCNENSGNFQAWESDIREIFKMQRGAVTAALKGGQSKCKKTSRLPDVSEAEVSGCATAWSAYKKAVDEPIELVKENAGVLPSSSQADKEFKVQENREKNDETKKKAEKALIKLKTEMEQGCATTFKTLKITDLGSAGTWNPVSLNSLAGSLKGIQNSKGDSGEPSNCSSVFDGQLRETLNEARSLRDAAGSAGSARD